MGSSKESYLVYVRTTVIIAVESAIYSWVLLAKNFFEMLNCCKIFLTFTSHLKNSFIYIILFNPPKTLWSRQDKMPVDEKLRFREIVQCVSDHMVYQWWSWDFSLSHCMFLEHGQKASGVRGRGREMAMTPVKLDMAARCLRHPAPHTDTDIHIHTYTHIYTHSPGRIPATRTEWAWLCKNKFMSLI